MRAPRATAADHLIDLVGLAEGEAKEKLLAGVRRKRAKPAGPPGFPGRAEGGGAGERTVAVKPRFPGALPEVWNVPQNRNPNFTGREELLGELRQALSGGQAVAVTALAGLGGVGKTQLAIEYTYRHMAEYDVVWWVRAEEAATLTADYARLGPQVGLAADPDQAQMAAEVRRWLGHNRRWLPVFDNAGEPADVRPYLPQGGGGHVLVTSRNQNWRGTARALGLEVFARAESVAFLLKRTGQGAPAGAAARAAAGAAAAAEDAAGKLAEELGDLPLALEQAAAYCAETGQTPAGYLALYRGAQRRVLLARFERALKIGEQVYGPEHPNVATEANNLGSVLRDLDDLAGARACFERALGIFETALGAEHPSTKTVRRNLEGLPRG